MIRPIALSVALTFALSGGFSHWDQATAAPPKRAKKPPPDPAALLASVARGADDAAVLKSVKRLGKKKALSSVIRATRHRDERVRRVAVLAIGALKARKARIHVARALVDRDPGVVLAAATTLKALGGRGVEAEVAQLLQHQSVSVRCGAADLLRRFRSKAAQTELEEGLARAKWSEERACILTALVRRGHRKYVAHALPLLEKDDTRALGAAILMLEPKAGRAALSAALAATPSEELVAAAVSIGAAQGRDGLNWIAALVRSKSTVVRAAALEVLLALKKDPQARKLLMSAATRADAFTRGRVIDALATGSPAQDLLPLARRWLRDKSPIVRAAAARVFGAAPRKSDGALLLRRYQTERIQPTKANLEVRVELLGALGAIGNPDWVPVFVDSTGQKGEAQAAVDALVRVGEPAVRTLLLVVKVGDMDRIPFALEALARIGRGVGDAAAGLFRHPREIVRELGRDLMAASGDPKAVGALLTLFRSESLEDPVPVIEAISTFNTPEARAALKEASDHPNVEVRNAAVEGLGSSHMRDKETVGVLLKVAETDSSPRVRSVAVRALFQVNAPGLAKKLIKLIQYDSGEVRRVAYEVLGWSGDPASAAVMAKRLAGAEGEDLVQLKAAIARVTRRDDLTSLRKVTDWYKGFRPAVVSSRKWKSGVVKLGKKGASGSIHYQTLGTGPVTVIAIPGHHAGAIYHPAMDRVAGSIRVVTYDPQGRGRSKRRAGRITLKSEVNDIEMVRRQVKAARVALLAHDAGGLVALQYARTYSKRVSRIILLNTPPRGTRHGVSATAVRAMRGKWAQDLARLDSRHAWFMPVAWLYYRQFAIAPGLVADSKHAPRVNAFPGEPVARQALQRSVAGLSLARLAATIKTPITLVVGDRAPFTGAERAALRKAAKKYGHVGLRRLKGVGHYPHLEKPGALAGTIGSLLPR